MRQVRRREVGGEPNRSTRRAAVTFLLVLALVLVTVAGAAAAISATVAQREAVLALGEGTAAEWVAYSGLEWALHRVFADPNWRTTLPVAPDGAWLQSWMQLGAGQFMVWGTDPDGSLADDPTDSVSLVVEAVAGKSSVRLTAALQSYPHPVLAYAALARGKHLVLKHGVQIEAPLRANTDINSDGTVQVNTALGGRLETLQGANVSPDLIPYTTFVPHPMDDVMPEFEWYLGRATPISTRQVRRASLTNTSFVIDGVAAQPNPEGIYVIVANGAEVELKDVYVRGTLLIDGPSVVRIDGGFRTQYRAGGRPTILVRSGAKAVVTVAIDRSSLDERVDGVDYNGDGDQLDVIGAALKGLVWVVKKIDVRPSVPFLVTGCVVGWDVHFDGPVRVQMAQGQEQWVVPGTLGPGLRLQAGSVQRDR